jgi:hypothetical protein
MSALTTTVPVGFGGINKIRQVSFSLYLLGSTHKTAL